MSRDKAELGDMDDVTEMYDIDATRVDGVAQPANRSPFLVVKGIGNVSPRAREAFRENAKRVKAGLRPRKGKVSAKGWERGPDGTITVAGPAGGKRVRPVKRRRVARSDMTVKAAAMGGYSQEIPVTGVPDEARSIMASVTGESVGLCSARTANGAACRRPAVAGGRCHFHR